MVSLKKSLRSTPHTGKKRKQNSRSKDDLCPGSSFARVIVLTAATDLRRNPTMSRSLQELVSEVKRLWKDQYDKIMPDVVGFKRSSRVMLTYPPRYTISLRFEDGSKLVVPGLNIEEVWILEHHYMPTAKPAVDLSSLIGLDEGPNARAFVERNKMWIARVYGGQHLLVDGDHISVYMNEQHARSMAATFAAKHERILVSADPLGDHKTEVI